MVFVSSAVLGAAAGTGLALLVAVTIVMYRYYVVRRKGKEWAELDRLEEKKAARKINLQECSVISGSHPVQPTSTIVPHSLDDETLGGPLDVSSSSLQPHLNRVKTHSERRKPPPSASRNNSTESVHSRASSYYDPTSKLANPETRSTVSDNFVIQKSGSPKRMRTYSLEGRLPLGYDRESRMSSAISVSPRDINSPKKRNSTVSCSTLPRSSDSRAIESPGGSPRSDNTRSPRRRVPIIMTANDINTVLGRFHLRLKYDGSKEELFVHLVEAQELTAPTESGFRDPYVRMFLDTDEENRTLQTAVHRTETHPYFDQNFSIPLKPRNLVKSNFILQLLDYDRFSRDEVVGEIRFLLNTMDLSGCEIWGDLIAVRKSTAQLPELLISLSYLPQAERLTVVVMKAKNLNVIHEPFVKLYLIVNDKRTKKRKTSAIRAADPANPIWNEAFTFEIPASQLQDVGVELFVASNEGEIHEPGCAIGLQEGGTGLQHWQDLMQNNRKPIAMWHPLQ
ncbi:synaptotagmin-5 [Toxorhynchites rutilus septentrionalis]|uniref:synaptotagmin-5 n=1 Tax=Toxorhynchites rutilus septentrionalis TaxID=329112 RepID=UPI002479B54F|nr:synaptotagmin-5 [Toxorhynchites rutilus septentrionalis]XP_055624903.1 synaptotagmin-5 [Toxorhynchites rutilus septentrionalis]XP_055624904.1 synaptotagmin-5 [Toxorhynchites rutilus septentrionalis]